MNPIDLMGFLGRRIDGIIHVGANIGQERDSYLRSGASACLYIEPAPDAFASLEANLANLPGHFAVRAVCSDTAGIPVTLNIANNGDESSSILPLGLHADLFPDVRYVGGVSMITRTLDDIVQTEAAGLAFNLLVIDAQGAELKVLRGATALLDAIDGIFVEVSEVPLYEGGCDWQEITDFLRGFGLFMKWMQIGNFRYGDAFYLRQPDIKMLHAGRLNLALNRPARQSSLSIYSTDNDAQGGNNGVRTGRYGFHTDLEKNPWWQVDLGRPETIREVRVFNRLDIAGERANSLKVLVSQDGHTWLCVHEQSGRAFGGIDGRPLRVAYSAYARFVRVQLDDLQYLHLDEIEVY